MRKGRLFFDFGLVLLGDVWEMYLYTSFFKIGYGNFVVVVVDDGIMTSLPPKRGKGKRRKVASLGTIFCQVSPWPLGTSFFLSPASACA